MIRSCSLQYGYSFKLENNGYSVYMNDTFHGHAPYVNGSLNLDRGNTHVHAKGCRVNNDSTTFSWHCRLGHIVVKHMKKLHADVFWSHLILNHLTHASHASWAG